MVANPATLYHSASSCSCATGAKIMFESNNGFTHRKQDPALSLIEQLQVIVGDFGKVTLEKEKPWASITFSGTRHYFNIACGTKGISKRLPAQLQKMPEADFNLHGHFVADLLIADHDASDDNISIDILTIIDPVSPIAGNDCRREGASINQR